MNFFEKMKNLITKNTSNPLLFESLTQYLINVEKGEQKKLNIEHICQYLNKNPEKKLKNEHFAAIFKINHYDIYENLSPAHYSQIAQYLNELHFLETNIKNQDFIDVGNKKIYNSCIDKISQMSGFFKYIYHDDRFEALSGIDFYKKIEAFYLQAKELNEQLNQELKNSNYKLKKLSIAHKLQATLKNIQTASGHNSLMLGKKRKNTSQTLDKINTDRLLDILKEKNIEISFDLKAMYAKYYFLKEKSIVTQTQELSAIFEKRIPAFIQSMDNMPQVPIEQARFLIKTIENGHEKMNDLLQEQHDLNSANFKIMQKSMKF